MSIHKHVFIFVFCVFKVTMEHVTAPDELWQLQ